MTTVTTRVAEGVLREMDTVAGRYNMDRSTLLRNLISKGLETERKEYALKLYKKRRITLQKMSEILGMTYLDAIELIKQEDLHLDYGLEELKEDLKGLQ